MEELKFLQINNKRFHSSDDIVSFSFSHPTSTELIEYKEQKREKIRKFYTRRKTKFNKTWA